MTAIESLDRLRQLRAEGARWMRFAVETNQVLSKGTWAGEFPTQTAYLIKASEASGYGISTIRRFFRLHDKMNELFMEYGEEDILSRNITMANLELLERMEAINQGFALEHSRSVIEGTITYREMLKHYNQVIANKGDVALPASKTGVRASRDIDRLGTELLGWNLVELSKDNDVEFIKKPTHTHYCKVDAIAVKRIDQQIVFVDGFKFVTRRGENITYQYFKVLEHVSFQAGFFRRFWVGFQQETGSQLADMLKADIAKLGLKSVGVFLFDDKADISIEKHQLDVLVEPCGVPNPDWQALYIQELQPARGMEE